MPRLSHKLPPEENSVSHGQRVRITGEAVGTGGGESHPGPSRACRPVYKKLAEPEETFLKPKAKCYGAGEKRDTTADTARDRRT